MLRRAASLAVVVLVSSTVARAQPERVQDPADVVADPELAPVPEPTPSAGSDDDVGDDDDDDHDDEGAPPRAGKKRVTLPDARVAPEPVADPETVDNTLRDPADGGLEPLAAEPMEHVETGGISPLSTSVDCPPGTAERRTRKGAGAELWCADARGRRHGPFLRLHPEGTLQLRGSYLDGRRHGLFLRWFPSGRLEGRSAFERGLEQGAEELFYESGRRRSTTTFRAGKKHGPYRAWHESGRLAVTGEYEGDVAAPGWVFYDESGRVRAAPSLTTTTTEADSSEVVSVDEVAANEAALSGKLAAAAGGAAGATAGVLLSIPVSITLIRLRVLGAGDPQAWLVLLLVPPVLAAGGAALGTALLTRFPGPVLAALGGVVGLPVGAGVGALVGGALASVLALAVVSAGAQPEATLGMLLVGLGVGAAAGAGVTPGLLAATAGWLYADPANQSE